MHSKSAKTDDLRDAFLSFFASKGHKIVESDSLVPKDDPTVLFTPAGMNQFKPQFLGLVGDYRRAATSQRCLRTGDLENVGRTPFHHTFFEMLGNFSFGDYFKQEAISWSWEFLTKTLSIGPEKLWVSVYTDDDEAFRIWRETVGVPAERIVRLGDKTNFWPAEAKQVGPNGPCGPCSEIFVDRGVASGCGKPSCTPACDCGRFVEVWNLVFTQFNRTEAGTLEPLPQKNIDTGMGLERLAAVMQGVVSNFETDIFIPIVVELKRIMTEQEWRSGESYAGRPVYAIADHIRAIVFAVYDGVLPSNEDRGYVVRKLIRKGVFESWYRGGRGFLNRLVPVVAQTMRKPYPELVTRQEDIAGIIEAEEKNFIAILDASKALFEEKFSGAAQRRNADETGRIVFRLYDTYGIPRELTVDWLNAKNIPFSQEAFERALGEQKSRSKQQSTMKGDVFDLKELHLDVPATTFVGYEQSEAEARVLKLIKGSVEVAEIVPGDEARIILDRTPFYAESGGQVGDTGVMSASGGRFDVTDTKKSENITVHVGRVAEGVLRKGDPVNATVDGQRRLAIARNHTATHLLQAALRQVLGEHVQQQGSLVAPERLRFDFAHFRQVAAAELERVEEIVNAHIMRNEPLKTAEMSLAEAKKAGALAFFGEKYDERVRMVSVSGISKELCGGTHLSSTGEIGLFRIVQEGSVASGVRRIEAITGAAALQLAAQQQKILSGIASELGVPIEKASHEVGKRLMRIREVEKQLAAARMEALKGSIAETLTTAEVINGVSLIVREYPDAEPEFLRKAVDMIADRLPAEAREAVIVGSSVHPSRISLAMRVKGSLLDASKAIKEIASEIGGSGGGRKDFAQAGGNLPGNREKAIQRLKGLIRQVGK